MSRHDWPGNIRELQSVLKQALLKASGPVLLPSFLPDDLSGESPPNKSDQAAPLLPSDMTLADLERTAIQQCLLETGGNRQRTAEILGISTRTLLRKIRQNGLDDPLHPGGCPAGEDLSEQNE